MKLSNYKIKMLDGKKFVEKYKTHSTYDYAFNYMEKLYKRHKKPVKLYVERLVKVGEII